MFTNVDAQFILSLKAAVGEENVRQDPETLERYGHDETEDLR